MKFKSPYLVNPHEKVRLAKWHAAASVPYRSDEAAVAVLTKHRNQLSSLQEVFFASQKKALLIVLQGMDTAGKDGVISHIFSGVNPQGCDVTAFKVPTPLEARHDFLWRAHTAVPPRGMIGIFNRSHYEDVLSPRVHKKISGKVMRRRLDDINAFEHMLADNDVLILKFFLHISRDEQRTRLKARLDNPDKQWKIAEADIHERKFWPQYEAAYDTILSTTSHKHAPWFIIPSNDKLARNLAISAIIVGLMQSLKLDFPKPTIDVADIKL